MMKRYNHLKQCNVDYSVEKILLKGSVVHCKDAQMPRSYGYGLVATVSRASSSPSAIEDLPCRGTDVPKIWSCGGPVVKDRRKEKEAFPQAYMFREYTHARNRANFPAKPHFI
ncbi:hypothetical protein TNCV_4969401 [Trichonephila clavipes]|nr:hypothetical protein TNCV_4969401 [Trichonephila clavipes]